MIPVIPGPGPFSELSLWGITFVFCSYFCGFCIRGSFGFGGNLPIVLLTTWILGPHHAIVLVVIAGLVSQIHLFPQSLRAADRRAVRSIIMGMLAGTVIGTWLLKIVDTEGLIIIMGILIMVIVVVERYDLVQRLSRTLDLRSRRLTTAIAFTAGSMGTLSGGGGMYFMVTYIRHVCPTPAVFRSTLIMLTAVFAVTRVGTFAVAGMIPVGLIVESILLIPAIFVGTLAGTRIFKTTRPERFYGALQVLLFLAAAALVWKGIILIW